MKETLPQQKIESEIPRSSTKNGLYSEGTMDISALTTQEEARLRQLDFKIWGEGKTLEGPLVRLESDEHSEYVSLLEKCGRKYKMADTAR